MSDSNRRFSVLQLPEAKPGNLLVLLMQDDIVWPVGVKREGDGIEQWVRVCRRGAETVSTKPGQQPEQAEPDILGEERPLGKSNPLVMSKCGDMNIYWCRCDKTAMVLFVTYTKNDGRRAAAFSDGESVCVTDDGDDTLSVLFDMITVAKSVGVRKEINRVLCNISAVGTA